MFVSKTQQLKVEVRDRVAIVTLNRPEARNALSNELTGELRRAIAWLATADEVGCLLLTGAGGAFCAGGDVKAMGARGGSKPAPTLESQFQEMRARHHEVAGAIRAMRKPSVAALPGAAAGAGMAIALACDLRIASTNAFLTTAYARIGLSGDYGIAWLLSRVVGPGRARQLMLTAARVEAEEALAIGLVTQVASPEEFESQSYELAHGLAHGPLAALAYMKDNLDEAFTCDHATAIDQEAGRLLKTRSTADHREAVAAFAEKRKPVFTAS